MKKLSDNIPPLNKSKLGKKITRKGGFNKKKAAQG